MGEVIAQVTTNLPPSSPSQNVVFPVEDNDNNVISLVEQAPSNEFREPVPNVPGGIVRAKRATDGDNSLEIWKNKPRSFFKGIIQDVQISNGHDKKQIVEFFKGDFDTNSVERPPTIGKVTLIGVKEGEVSDNTCKANPCENGGSCQVTWNDFECTCLPGWKGRTCLEKEYCHWNKCPHQSRCQSLADGHECVGNATFNGVNSTLLARPILTSKVENATDIMVRFRSRSNGTLLQITQTTATQNKYIRLTLLDNQIKVEIPETDNEMHEYLLDVNNVDGGWHTIKVKFENDLKVSAVIDDTNKEQALTFDSAVPNLAKFVENSKIIVGASIKTSPDQDLAYSVAADSNSAEDTTLATAVIYDINSGNESWDTQYRGCMEELRIAGVLVPFFTPAQLIKNTAADRFDVETMEMVETAVSGCILCYEHECQNNGFCSKPNEKFECDCQEGFEGDTCAININECEFNKCVHGTCEDKIANYTCNCLTGWDGWLCNEDFDECLDKPCKNNGICRQTVEPGNYTCDCTDQFRGHNCEQLKNRTCEDKPCRNGAICRNEINDINHERYTCDCNGNGNAESLYKGVDCDEKRDFCKESYGPCQNGATCISDDLTFDFKCICVPGYTGEKCEYDIDECANQPCNGGQCQNLLNDFSCECADTGFRGDRCENDINECIELNPCHHGQCDNLNGSYNCLCDQGYCGKNCHRLDECLMKEGLCKNDGKCVATCDEAHPPYYKCECTDEWDGVNCTIKSSRRAGDVALIVGPVVGGMLFIAIVGTLVFLIMARRKRRSEGKYKPASQELTSPRLQLDNLIKPPPEERLI